MFGKNRKKEEIKNNVFGDQNYQMKDKYNADELVIANLERVSDEESDFGIIDEVTKQKYIFEIINENENIRYREIFTGFIADNNVARFYLPYVVNPKPFTDSDYFPETKGKQIPKLAFLWLMNEINHTIGQEDRGQMTKN